MGVRLLGLAVLATALSGCSYVREYVADIDMSSAAKFCEKKRTNPEIRPIVGKLPIVSVDEITPDMLVIDDVPTADEIVAIRALSRDQRDCRERTEVVAKDYWPTQGATRKELAMKLDLVTAQLLQQKLSYGSANRLYQEAALYAENRFTADRKEQLAQARAREAEAWRTVGDGIRAIAGSKKPERNEDSCFQSDGTDCQKLTP
jgi:hypothetical protein